MHVPTVIVTLLMLSVMLAGCGSDGAPETEPELGVDEEIKVTSTTGAIRGVVVDPAVTPIAGAAVRIASLELETKTNEAGEFVFIDLEPATYFLQVTKPGYAQVQSSADVVAGDEKPPVVKVQLERLPGSEPTSFTRTWDGQIQCSVRFVVNAIAACSTVAALEDDFAVRYDDLSPVPTFVQSEMVWENTQQLGESLKLEYTDDSSGLDNYRIHQGTSPLVINADNATLEAKHFSEVGLLIRVFTGSYQGTGLSVTLQQPFTVYTSVFNNYAPPADWLFSDSSKRPDPPQ